jgi:hypothetical protein
MIMIKQPPNGDDFNGPISPRGEEHEDPAFSTQSNVVPLRSPPNSVGYGRPPTHSRFKPGQSGNPKGRPKGRSNVVAERRKFYTAKVVIREGGKKRRVSRLAAVDWSIWHRAMKGDVRAAQLWFANARGLGLSDATGKGAIMAPVVLHLDEVDANL